MRAKEFDLALQQRVASMQRVLGMKAGEYARGEDRLNNFKRAAAMLQVTPEKALIGMWAKHIISILDMVDDLDLGRTPPLMQWDEKIGDAINYLVLLEALIHERQQTVGAALCGRPHKTQRRKA